MAELDLLDIDNSQSKVKPTKVGADYSSVLDQMKSKLSITADPKIRSEILNATLESIKVAAGNDKTDLLSAIKDLTDFQDSVGAQFEGFLKMNSDELNIITGAENSLNHAQIELTEAEQHLKEKESVEPAWYRFSRKKNIRLAKESLEQSKLTLTSAQSSVKDAKEKANILYRQRLETADMETLLTEYTYRSEKTCEQLKGREKEIKEAETILIDALGEASKIHQQALVKKEEHEGILEKKKAELVQAQNALLEITDKQSPGFATQQKIVVDLQQAVDEESGLVNSYMNLAASKDSFVQKHNIATRSLTILRSNLQSHRAKLKSDTDERAKFYQGYLIALKARNDQELAAVLDKLGNKTDESIAETLSKILVGSSKARQEMMNDIPLHEKNIAEIISGAMEGLHAIREKDKALKQNFEDRYGINMELQFESTYDNTNGGGTTKKDENTSNGGGKDNKEDDLLG